MPPASGLLKTCQTCFRAKIRCDKTQSSGRCDRCLRLDKPCVFAPSRRHVQTRGASQTAPASQTSQTETRSVNTNTGNNVDANTEAASPFDIVSFQEAADQLDQFRSKFTNHFPFVILDSSLSVQQLHESKPLLCIAVLTATCTGNVKKQRALGALFNKTVASRLVAGPLVSLETLQALLVSLAWCVHPSSTLTTVRIPLTLPPSTYLLFTESNSLTTSRAQYQPRPRRYSQHLYLAASIVTDLRMDRPVNPDFWTTTNKPAHQVQWTPDEIRAICGLYYLASR